MLGFAPNAVLKSKSLSVRIFTLVMLEALVYLLERINAMVKEHGKAVGTHIVNVDTLLNHRIDYTFSAYAGAVLARVVRDQHIDVILTAEASGISVAVFTAMTVNNEQWPHPASVVFAKKSRPITLPEGGYHVVDSFSRTKNRPVQLFLGSHVIQPGDRIFIVDDFLAQGTTLAALGDLVEMARADIAAFGVVLEKTFEHGRDSLTRFNAPVYSLVKITGLENDELHLASPSLS